MSTPITRVAETQPAAPVTDTKVQTPARAQAQPASKTDSVTISAAAQAALAAEQLANDSQAQLEALAASGNAQAQALLTQDAQAQALLAQDPAGASQQKTPLQTPVSPVP